MSVQSCSMLWGDTNGSCRAVLSPIFWDLGTFWEGEEQVSAVPPSRQAPILPLESPKALGQVCGTTETTPWSTEHLCEGRCLLQHTQRAHETWAGEMKAGPVSCPPANMSLVNDDDAACAEQRANGAIRGKLVTFWMMDRVASWPSSSSAGQASTRGQGDLQGARGGAESARRWVR